MISDLEDEEDEMNPSCPKSGNGRGRLGGEKGARGWSEMDGDGGLVVVGVDDDDRRWSSVEDCGWGDGRVMDGDEDEERVERSRRRSEAVGAAGEV